MDQRTTIGTGRMLTRPIHRACVVPGCWCGSTTTAGASSSTTDHRGSGGRTIRTFAARSTNLTAIALRSVGLPVV